MLDLVFQGTILMERQSPTVALSLHLFIAKRPLFEALFALPLWRIAKFWHGVMQLQPKKLSRTDPADRSEALLLFDGAKRLHYNRTFSALTSQGYHHSVLKTRPCAILMINGLRN